MRFVRLAAFAAWMVVALLAVAGFAAFSPDTATPTTTTTESRSASSHWGSTSGRVMAFALTSGLRPAPPPPDDSADIKAAQGRAAPDPEPPSAAPPGNATSNPVQPTTTMPSLSPEPPVGSPTTTTTTLPADPPVDSPTTTTTLTPRSGTLTEQQVRAVVALFFAPDDIDRAVAVAHCESRWDPTARNPVSGAAGLFQQIPGYWAERSAAAGWAGADIFEAHANAAVSAWLVYEGGGWEHWSASRACWS